MEDTQPTQTHERSTSSIRSFKNTKKTKETRDDGSMTDWKDIAFGVLVGLILFTGLLSILDLIIHSSVGMNITRGMI